MTEIWNDIIDFEGFYQVSNFGKIKTLSRINLGLKLNSTGISNCLLGRSKSAYKYNWKYA